MDNTKLSRSELSGRLRSVGFACTPATAQAVSANSPMLVGTPLERLKTWKPVSSVGVERDQPGNDVVPVDEVADRGEGIHDDGTTGQGYRMTMDATESAAPATVHVPQSRHCA